jgi:adenylylsulfate kinase
VTGVGAVVWLTGRPGSGKSTLASRIALQLRQTRVPVAILDGDEIRDALVPRPGHDEASRHDFYLSLGRLAAVLARQGLVVLVPATAHRRAWRDAARQRAPRFVEVHVDTPLEECRRRDPKGLYARAAALPALPGVGVPYEPPLHAEVVAAGGGTARTIDAVLAWLGVGGVALSG